MDNNKITITVVGDGYIGKTAMLIVYKDKKYDETYCATVIDVYSMKIPINKEEYTVILQDTGGQEEFDQIRSFFYKDTDVFIVCYSVADRNSLDNAREKWAPEIRRYCPQAKLILAGTKCDLQQTERKVRTIDGQTLAKQIKADGFIENSAKEGINVDETIHLALLARFNQTDGKKKKCVIS